MADVPQGPAAAPRSPLFIAAPAWVVIGSDGKISPFETRTAAEQWLNAGAEICTAEDEANAREVPVPVGVIISERSKRPSPPQPILNRDRGCVGPFLVIDPSMDDGRPFRKLREWLPVNEVGDPLEGKIEAEIDIQLEGLGADCTRFLSDEFAWDAISKSASRKRGHVVRAGVGGPLALRIVAAAYDLEDGLIQQHPALSGKSAADFWKSWQVHYHLTNFAARIEKAQAPADPWERHALHRLIGAALDHVLEVISIYSRETEEGPDVTSKPDGIDTAGAAEKGLPAYLAAVEALVGGKSKSLQTAALAIGLYIWFKSELGKVKQVTRKDTRNTPSQLEAQFEDFEVWGALDDSSWRTRAYKTKQDIARNDFDAGGLAWALTAHRTGLKAIEQARTLRRYQTQLRMAGLNLPGVDEFR